MPRLLLLVFAGCLEPRGGLDVLPFQDDHFSTGLDAINLVEHGSSIHHPRFCNRQPSHRQATNVEAVGVQRCA
jgi:hypothetical protein